MTRTRHILLAATLCLATLLAPAADATAAQAATSCRPGSNACVDLVIRQMRQRFNPLARRCDHDAVFSLTYLRTTEAYRRAVQDPRFFDDNAFVNRVDVAFADLYFRAYDRWHAGRSGVPPAWQTAFAAADRRQVSGSGNLLLGMSAHVNRDLPFVYEQLGIVAPDGTSRYDDHQRVNDILETVAQPLLDELSRRFDPTINDANVDGTTLDDEALLQLLFSWREEAWRNAERLVAARTPQERALVAQSIEDSAVLKAQALVLESAYRPPLTSSQPRDAFCAEHWDDA